MRLFNSTKQPDFDPANPEPEFDPGKASKEKSANSSEHSFVLKVVIHDEEMTRGYFIGINDDESLNLSPDDSTKALHMDKNTAELLKQALHSEYGSMLKIYILS